MYAKFSVQADEIGKDPSRPGDPDRYQFVYRARNEADARKALAGDEATLRSGHLAVYSAYWTGPSGWFGKGTLTVIFDYHHGDDVGPAWQLPIDTVFEPVDSDRQPIDLRAELPAAHQRLPEGPPVLVVGESHHREAIEAAVGQRPAGHDTTIDAVMALEPDNPYDRNAVAVMLAGRVCGYIAREDAARWGPILAWFAEQGVTPVVRARVKGGWREERDRWADFGITLYVASPKDLAARQRTG